jgi:hypothetical protein
MNPNPPVRRSPIAGAWYPSNPEVLRSEIDGYIDAASESTLPGEVIGLIAPHAGYFYSGHTAGYAYRSVKGMSFDTCAIFSPLHDYMPNNFLTSAHEAYATPLGQVPVDHELVEACSRSVESATGDTLQHIANDREHSLEIQLPFLQRALAAPFTLLPVMVRTHDPVLLETAAKAIAECLKGKNILFVASTDLSHFYDEQEANTLDTTMLNRMTAFAPEGVLKAERCGEGFACGAGAVALMLWTTRFLGASQVTLLHHSTSADASGDSSRVVGYGALAVTR